jgi:hypothetical protein
MSEEILIFEELMAAEVGSIGYTEDIDADSVMELEPLSPDGVVSVPEGFKKILVSGGSDPVLAGQEALGRIQYFPYWSFVWAEEVGGIRQVI